ncbi:MAG TPA: hypothetical protein VH370_25215 [Humisphaera sp.]|jgi:hypothetical protein|nr:hypothetical protein [Humisphaera sp.]
MQCNDRRTGCEAGPPVFAFDASARPLAKNKCSGIEQATNDASAVEYRWHYGACIMTPSKKKLIVRIVTLAIGVGLIGGVWDFVDGRAVNREAQLARRVAAESTTPDITPEHARTWLQQHGYQVIIWDPHASRGYVGSEDGDDGKFVIVYGQRQIRTGRWLGKPVWLDLIFRFDPKERFHDVTAHSSHQAIRFTTPAL